MIVRITLLLFIFLTVCRNLFCLVDSERIGDEYDIDYELNINTKLGQNFHVGYFDNSNDNYYDAVEKLTILASKPFFSNENNNIVLLDLGCGVGYASKLISKRYECSVVGIDISNKAIEYAKTLNKNQSLNFYLMNAHKLTFKSECFDGVFCIESLFHCDKYVVLKECFRVLKKGGVISICDFYKKEGWFDELEWNSSVIPLNEFIDILKTVGFQNVKFSDITENVVNSFDFWKHREVTPNIKQNWLDSLEIFKTSTGYVHITAEKH